MQSIEILDKIYQIYKDKNKCIIDESYDYSLFCIDCNKFFCEKCFENHDTNHKNIKISNIEEKINSYKSLFNSTELEQEKVSQAINKFSEIIKNINGIYKDLSTIFECRFSLLKKKKINEEIKEIKAEDIDSLYNKITEDDNIENKEKYFIDYYKLIEDAIKENENNIQYKIIINYVNQLNNQIMEQNNKIYNNYINNNLFNKLKDVINSTEAIFYKLINKKLNISHKEYLSEKNMLNFRKNLEDVKKGNKNDLNKSQIFNQNSRLSTINTDQINKENKREKLFIVSIENSFQIITNQALENDNIIEKEIFKKKFENNKLIIDNNISLNIIIEQSKINLNIKNENKDNENMNKEEQNIIINDIKDKNSIGINNNIIINSNDLNKINDINNNDDNDSNEINDIKDNDIKDNDIKYNDNKDINQINDIKSNYNNDLNKNNDIKNIDNKDLNKIDDIIDKDNNDLIKIKDIEDNDNSDLIKINDIKDNDNDDLIKIKDIEDNDNNDLNIINDIKNNDNNDLNEIKDIKNNDNNYLYKINDIKINNESSDLDYSESLNSINNLKKSTIFLDSFEVYTEENIEEIMKEGQTKDIFDNIKTIKQIEKEEVAKINKTKNKLEKGKDIEKHRKSCINKINEINKKINIFSSPISQIVKEIKYFDMHERNFLEIMSPKNNGEKIYIFNPYLNEIEEILIPSTYKFPKNFAYLNILPYCYVSGGIKDDNNILTNFFAIKRKGYKLFEFVELAKMPNKKYNHCMVELKHLGGLGIIGGWNSKSCEYFNFKKKEWKSLPTLNHIRESPSCCVINKTNLFCFLGYDNELNIYNDTFEKCNLQTMKWEEINPIGMKKFMERKAAGCLLYSHRENEIIIIVGGINNIEKETKDILIYDEKNNTIDRKKNRLPYKSSFSQNSFHLLCLGYYCNFNINSSIIQYEEFGEVFFGLSEI